MGMDVYLSWNGMTKKEKDEQITGYSIDAGNKGYLRASYGMSNECSFLESFFEGFFEISESLYDQGGKIFDFSDENWQKLCKLGRLYLIAVMMGKEIKTPKTIEGEKMVNNIKGMLSAMQFQEDTVESAGFLGIPDAVCWLNSMFEFFRLGYDKQKAGKKVRVNISY